MHELHVTDITPCTKDIYLEVTLALQLLSRRLGPSQDSFPLSKSKYMTFAYNSRVESQVFPIPHFYSVGVIVYNFVNP